MTDAFRISALRERLGWPQHRMGSHLGVAQSAVHNMERNGHETGPVSKLLDLLALDHGFADLTAERFAARQKQGDAA